MRIDTIAKQSHSKLGDHVLMECRYACEVSEADGGRWDECILAAVKAMELSVRSEGALTNAAASAAEQLLLPMSETAKQYTVLFAGHAHIDMNWLWRYDETVAITLETFRTVLDLLDEYPQFLFSQSQAAVYEIVERYDPDLLNRIRQRVAEGRWEVTASTWVEADRNMPSGESAARHLLYTRRYLSKLMQMDPKRLNLDFEPDTFGHGRMTPEILAQAGVHYQYHCRGDEGEILYRWRAPSGAEVLCFREPNWYLGPVHGEMVLGIPAICRRYQINTMLRVYGVGDHGGGPTRRDIERLIDMARWPVFPTVRFGTFGEFFAAAEKSPCLPMMEGELNPVFTGCYTSQSRIKQGNRFSEARLREAEMFSAQSALCACTAYQHKAFEEAWHMVLFNQFHDILPGSCLIDGREFAMGEYARAYALADTQKLNALRGLCAQADTSRWLDGPDTAESVSEGGGVGYGVGQGLQITQTERGCGINRIFHIFNPSPVSRQEVVELTMFDWPGNYRRLTLIDGQRHALPLQIIDAVPQQYWQHSFVRILTRVALPAGGRTVCICEENPEITLPPNLPAEPRLEKPYSYVLENERLKAIISTDTGSLISLIDKENGREYIGAPGAAFRIIDEQPAENTAGTAWTVGRHRTDSWLTRDVTIRKPLTGTLKNAVSVTTCGHDSRITYTVSISKGASWLDIDCDVDWREIGIPNERTPQLSFTVPLQHGEQSFLQDIPGGVAQRTAIAQDMPCQSFSAVKVAPDTMVMLLSDSTYGFRCEAGRNGGISMSLNCLRSSSDPDPYPEIGRHHFRIGIALSGVNCVELLNRAYAFCHPPTAISDRPRHGTLPLHAEGIGVSGVYLQAVKLSEDGKNLLLRLVCPEEETAEATVTLWTPPKAAYLADIHEQPLPAAEEVQIRGKTLCLRVHGGSTVTLCVTM